MKIESSAGWVLSGIILILAGLIAGVAITANYGLSIPSAAEEYVSPAAQMVAAVNPSDWRSPFVAVADEVLPAVVSVDTKRTISRSADPFRDMLREFFGRERFRDQFGDEDTREYEVPGSASGFILDSSGHILTNNHVVRGANEIEVTLSDGREFDAEIVGQDPSTDIAVIKIDGPNLPTARLGDSDGIRVGDWAIAVGNPLELEGTVTVGVVSAVGRVNLNIRGGAPLYQDFIQTDASINFGNSGGPLVNINGEVIGVNSAINPMANGIGFAIPINLARGVAESLMKEGKVVRGYLGVVPQEISRELAEAKNLESTDGIIIASIENGTPADDAGLRPGDVVTEFNSVEVEDVPQFRRIVAEAPPGKSIEIKILRDGRRDVVRAKLRERPDEFAAAEEPESEGKAWFGIDVVGLRDPLARDFEIEAESGVLVVGVTPGSPAADGGLLVGDVIMKIGDNEIDGLADYNGAIKELEDREKAVAFMVKRGRYTYFVAVKPEKK